MPQETYAEAVYRLAGWLLNEIQSMDLEDLNDLDVFQSIGPDEIPITVFFDGDDPDTFDVEPGHDRVNSNGQGGVWTGIGPWDNETTVQDVANELSNLFGVLIDNEQQELEAAWEAERRDHIQRDAYAAARHDGWSVDDAYDYAMHASEY